MLDILRTAKATGSFQELMDAIPYAKLMGFQIKEDDGGRIAVMPFNESNIGNPALPALHGGTVGALLESTAVFEVLWTVETIVLPKVITVTIDYLRSAGPRDLYAGATITRHGRRVATVHASAWQEDRKKPVATAIVHMLLKVSESSSNV